MCISFFMQIQLLFQENEDVEVAEYINFILLSLKADICLTCMLGQFDTLGGD